MAAAVADYRPAARSPAKIKKDGRPPEPVELTENPDILAGLAAERRGRVTHGPARPPGSGIPGPGRVRRRDRHVPGSGPG